MFSWYMQGRLAQSVMCLTTDMCLTADSGVASSILARSLDTFMEIDHEIISTAILLSFTDSRKASESMCTKYWLTAKSSLLMKKGVVRWTDHLDTTKANDWDGKHQSNPPPPKKKKKKKKSESVTFAFRLIIGWNGGDWFP